MAKVEKNITPDSTGMGGTEVTTVAHEVYSLKPNEKNYNVIDLEHLKLLKKTLGFLIEIRFQKKL